jgi:tRNA threonylcarbamoyl adenosine modification protein (Sua5/YciO/YrdC/YwlC family)
MALMLEIHPRDPQQRRIAQAAQVIGGGGLAVFPTDSCYALGCRIGDKAALERIRAIRRLGKRHPLTLVCRDLSEIAVYARVDNLSYRLIRSMTPGPYTFILPATKQVPKRLQHPRRRTVGIRVPAHPILAALLDELGEPLLSTTMELPGDDGPLVDPFEIQEAVGSEVDLVIDGRIGGIDLTSVIDLVGPSPEVIRTGMGEVQHLL